MQYHQQGGSRSRMPPFARGGAHGRGYKQFYPPQQLPPPPPLPAAAAAPPPPLQDKFKVLMEAGRLAAEHLVAKGVLPPASMQRRGVGWAQLPPPPPPPPPPLPPAPEAPAFYDARNAPRRFDDEHSNPSPRSRRSRGGEYSNNNSSNYNGRGKRKFGAHNRYSVWGRDRERSRGYSDSRSRDDDEDEDGAPPGYRRERRGSGVFDEVGSSVSGVAGEGAASKTEATGESEVEDTGSKVSSSSNVRKDADALQEVEDENEANKMHEDSKPSNSEVVDQGTNVESNSNHASSVVVEEAETKHSSVLSDEKPDDSSVVKENIEDGKTSGEMVEDDLSGVENNLRDDCKNLLNYCTFARAPTRPRSILAHRNAAPAHREAAMAEQIDLVSSEDETHMAIDVAEHGSSLTNFQEDAIVCLKHTDPSTTCNQMLDPLRFQKEETQIETDHLRGQNSITQHFAVHETKEHTELSPKLASQQNSLKLQVQEGKQICNVDTLPQDEDLIASADKGKIVGLELLPSINAEAVVTLEEEQLGQPSSFKICDLNLVGSPEVAELRNDPVFGQCSATGCSTEPRNQQQADFGTIAGDNASDTDRHAQIPSNSKAVQVIDIEDDSPIESGACDISKVKSEMVYSSMENIMNPTVNTDNLPGIQDGYNLAISDFLGADIPCYQSMQTDFHDGIGLNDSEGIIVMDDPIYSSLSDIGFMEGWDQPPQDYEKFF